ncbi:hypothetical protein C8R45DRAFT_1224760 [Mycena sanguinolenta]|nr:hypothetical protein C8R45DRAFT_1224760 [Mycena sanguinolenta]
MGALISSVRDELAKSDDEAAKKKKQNLEILQKLIDGQLDKFEAELNAKFLNPQATEKIEVPGIRPLRKVRFSTAEAASTPAAGVGKAIDDFFGIGDDGVSTKKALKDGFR